MRFGLLQADWVNAEFIANHGDLPDMFANYLNVGRNVEMDVFEAYKGRLPGPGYRCDAFIITGSRASATDERAWLRALKSFIRNPGANCASMIGFCFGHQLIAEALGGTVVRGDWNVGVRSLRVSNLEPWMRPTAQAVDLIFNHRDQVVVLPPQARLIAGDRHCPVQMFSIGNRYLGIQGHPEYSTSYQEALMSVAGGLAESDRVDAVRRNATTSIGGQVVRDWIRAFVQGARASPSSAAPSSIPTADRIAKAWAVP